MERTRKNRWKKTWPTKENQHLNITCVSFLMTAHTEHFDCKLLKVYLQRGRYTLSVFSLTNCVSHFEVVEISFTWGRYQMLFLHCIFDRKENVTFVLRLIIVFNRKFSTKHLNFICEQHKHLILWRNIQWIKSSEAATLVIVSLFSVCWRAGDVCLSALIWMKTRLILIAIVSEQTVSQIGCDTLWCKVTFNLQRTRYTHHRVRKMSVSSHNVNRKLADKSRC